jgi:hypothetical protein
MLTLFHDEKILKLCQICFTLPSPISESLNNNAWYTNQKNIIWTSVKFLTVPTEPDEYTGSYTLNTITSLSAIWSKIQRWQ